MLVRYDSEHRRMWMDQITRVKKERPFLLRHVEACSLISALAATATIRGDLAEVGVAFGASAKIISMFAANRTLHLFDTFEGLPEPTPRDSQKYKTGQYSCSLESVQQYLADMNVEFHKGLFPLTAEAVADKLFSFVHLDMDLYEGTLAALQFFYPRLSPGGVLISHDYLLAKGVKAAFTEFFVNKPETVIELTGDQCMIVRLGEGASGEHLDLIQNASPGGRGQPSRETH
jgi:O-methyltransferase